MDEHGYVITDELMRTNVPGVFAAGEIQDPIYRQVATSVGQGAAAAIQLGAVAERAGIAPSNRITRGTIARPMSGFFVSGAWGVCFPALNYPRWEGISESWSSCSSAKEVRGATVLQEVLAANYFGRGYP